MPDVPDVQGDVGPLCECVVDEDCSGVLEALHPCEIGVCDASTCECVVGSRKEGATCEDGDLCTFGTICAGGECTAGEIAQCDDGEPCTQDACHPVDGCVHVAVEVPCDDDDPCTATDLCENGQCVGADLLVCEDGKGCTDDFCESGVGCVFQDNEAACDDGKACTEVDLCESGICVGGNPPECEDGNDCTHDDCVDFGGCTNTPVEGACDDGDPCLLSLCQEGACVAISPVECEDENACTVDSCGSFGCAHVPKNCDDGNPCTEDSCQEYSGCQHVSVDCSDGNPCTTDQCADGLGCFSTSNASACDDGDPCTYGDVCSDGTCLPGDLNSCDDGNECTLDECDITWGCKHVPVQEGSSCDDGNPCTQVDDCVMGQCVGQTLKDCDDGNPCTANPCLETLGCTAEFIDAFCEDGNDCTIGDHCAEGSCKGAGFLECGDDNTCTADTCVPGQGCVHSFLTGSACDDGLACNGNDDVCKGNLCSGASCECYSDEDCPDDGNACNGIPSCHTLLNTCMPGIAVACQSLFNSCAVAECNPETGACENLVVDDGTVCDDEDLCTVEDQCTGGQCAGWELECPATGPCISSECEPEAGECVFTLLNGLSCEDDDPCTDTGTCVGGTCNVSPGNCAGGCDPMGALSCGDIHGSLMGWLGAPSEVPGDVWGCTTQPYPGSQWSVEFKPLVDGPVTISLYDEVGTVDLFVLEDAGGTCNPDLCLAHGYSSVTFDAIASKTVHVVFDSPTGVGNDAGLAIKCGDSAISGCVSAPEGGCGGCECEACTCALNPACCSESWTEECAELCGLFCGGDCEETNQDCCVEGKHPSCADADCANCVCADDPFCCEVLWDPTCALVAFEDCDPVCSCTLGDGDCCEGNSSPGCAEPGCQACVCGLDPFCCEASWDFLCAADAAFDGPCGAHCNCAGNSPFNCCQGFASPGCPPLPECEACVCGADPFCCNVTWDGVCGQKALQGCPGVCGCPSTDESVCCDSKPGVLCQDNTCQECVCQDHPECCSGPWTEECAKSAKSDCSSSCGCWSIQGNCCEPQEGPGCADPVCQDCLCSVDPFCCNVLWDVLCVGEAVEFCPAACACVSLE